MAEVAQKMNRLIHELSEHLKRILHLPEDEQYNESLGSYFSNQESNIKPACVLRPQNSGQVAKAVSLLVKANKEAGIGVIKFAVRSGGHAWIAGSANIADGVTIDLRGLNSIEVAGDSASVAVACGASWGQVYRTLGPLGLAVAGGRQSQIGVGGLTLGGGLSHFSGEVGLVCDTVLEYEIVLASGELLRIREESVEHQDLFQALRGGSNNFGIVTRFVFRTFQQGPLYAGMVMHPMETKNEQLQTFYNYCTTSPIDPQASLMQTYGLSAERGTGCVNSMVHTKARSDADVLKPFMALQPVYMNTMKEISLVDFTLEQDAFNAAGLCQLMVSTTYYVDLPLLRQSLQLYETSCDKVRNCAGIVWSLTFQTIPPTVISKSPFLQAVISTLPESPTTIIIAQITGTWKNDEDTTAVEAAAVQFIEDVEKLTKAENMQTGYTYLNYAHEGQKVFGEGRRLEELRSVSRRYDPDGIFQRCVPGGFKLW